MNTAVKEVQVIKATITGEKTEKIRVAAYTETEEGGRPDGRTPHRDRK